MDSVGVLAVQGDFEKHVNALRRLGLSDEQIVEVRTTEDLERVGRLIIPGGESTTVGLLLQRYGLGESLKSRADEGMPVWGTCMGMILMAKEIDGRPSQYSLGLLDIGVARNAFGAQVHSFEEELEMKHLDSPLTAVFIRAPVVTRVGPGVEVLATYDDQVVAVQEGRLLGTSFHPELTEDTRLHVRFLSL